ncbi:TPA: aspartyl-tRNA synthetase [Burkholderia aenigmatica]|uniref:aspartyl-tRNA synthetase n=1 Tax=Burkholderia sp. AU45251 TaxID=3059204 RepID=UPI0026505D10|nr:aspartyl-tRNA synthetase [Burkholderia sp. AU45251]HDR9483554.1 aspartyl-tRNA synthetase [Burkholderia aenigmatica]MDN7519205.1 aspartyl-tRNA synthetase [Burkholderia sp. AU45251]HDR9488529.1 aspartyl-tRNA synthetase [Burkholderia aenigmatica]HDR9514503.1 aspartyl-tRNA synthetase [Burkholderia aenigmatica]HDR9520295.1 aspartyl-tRNA synthetase [Burkholderia aenigmatica]
MNDERETADSGWYVDPVAGTVAGQLPVTLAVDSRGLKKRAVACAVLAAAGLSGYAAEPALWPVAALAVLLALAGVAFFVSSRRRMALQVDETGFRLIGAVREQPVTRWRDVTEFRIISVAGNRYIGYQFSAHSSRTRVPGGVMLPISRFVDLPLDAVAGLLEACRRQFGMPDNEADRTGR